MRVLAVQLRQVGLVTDLGQESAVVGLEQDLVLDALDNNEINAWRLLI